MTRRKVVFEYECEDDVAKTNAQILTICAQRWSYSLHRTRKGEVRVDGEVVRSFDHTTGQDEDGHWHGPSTSAATAGRAHGL